MQRKIIGMLFLVEHGGWHPNISRSVSNVGLVKPINFQKLLLYNQCPSLGYSHGFIWLLRDLGHGK
jgi:hypothetical protein